MALCSSYSVKGSLDMVKSAGTCTREDTWGNASLSHSSRCQTGGGTNGQFLPPHIFIFMSFPATMRRDPLRKHQSCSVNSTIRNHHSTSPSCEDSTVTSVQCFSNYKVLMNHLGTFQKYRFKFNRSGVQPKCLHF